MDQPGITGCEKAMLGAMTLAALLMQTDTAPVQGTTARAKDVPVPTNKLRPNRELGEISCSGDYLDFSEFGK